MWMVAANFRRTDSPSQLAWSEGWRPPGAQSAFIKWTGWTLAFSAWWQHHNHCRGYYYYYYLLLLPRNNNNNCRDANFVVSRLYRSLHHRTSVNLPTDHIAGGELCRGLNRVDLTHLGSHLTARLWDMGEYRKRTQAAAAYRPRSEKCNTIGRVRPLPLLSFESTGHWLWFFCMCMSHNHSSPTIETEEHRSSSKVTDWLTDFRLLKHDKTHAVPFTIGLV